MALFPSARLHVRNTSSWKLVTMLVVSMFSLAFILFRGSNSAQQPPLSAPEVVILNTVSVPRTVDRLPADILNAVIHYASTNIVPQQTREEIMITAKVLADRGPCNFLVFGLGHDSLLWKTLNYKGRTVFLEESDEWVKQVTGKHPELEAYLVEYTTVLTEAESLMQDARSNRKGRCTPVQNLLLSECKLALNGLPNEIYQVEWDVIMVDAPRGYFPEAPGRMSAIFSASVMARSRKAGNGTDIFVHDIERPVEKSYSEEFLCKENFVEEVGHLWHFKVMPSPSDSHEFCSYPGSIESKYKSSSQQ